VAYEPVRKQAKVNGINMVYYDWESPGATVVLYHNSSGFGRIWDWVARELHPDFRVICPDGRGHGDTDKPSSGYAAEDHAADLEDLIGQLGLDWIIIGGHSLGFRVSTTYTAMHPEQVKYLVLVGGPHYVSLIEDEEEAELTRQQAAAMRAAPRGYASLEEARQHQVNIRPHLSAEAIEHILTYNLNHLPDGRVEWKYDPEAVAQGLEHIPDDLKPNTAKVKCPVLIARAEHSRELTPERLPNLEPLYPTGRWVTIPGAVQHIQLEKPVVLANAIRDFVWERLD
jgi:pimeloyl-ACP methyl ester carboxylesterase